MKIIFLGTNGWYDTKTGNTVCTLIDSKKYYIIFDAGDGIYKLDKYIKKNKPIYLFLSHLHLEHISGFHIFSKFNFKQGISVFLQKGKKIFLDKLVNSPYTKPLKKLSFSVKLHELIEGEHKIPFPLNCKRLSHTDSSLGFNIEIDGVKIAYCSDTNICKSDIELSKNADVLIHECSSGPGKQDGGWGHSNPEEVARMAKKASVKKLFLTHFTPTEYPSLGYRKTAESLARKIFKNTTAVRDNTIIKV